MKIHCLKMRSIFAKMNLESPDKIGCLQQDSYVSDRATCHSTSMAFLNVGHGCHWTYHLKSLYMSSIHFCSHRLFHKISRSCLNASVSRSVICKFIKKEIIYRYRIPKRIISDNATNLNNKMMEQICE